VNLGSDHPSIMEAMVKGQTDRPDQFPKIYTCPNEMVALSMADGFARLTGKPQCVSTSCSTAFVFIVACSCVGADEAL